MGDTASLEREILMVNQVRAQLSFVWSLCSQGQRELANILPLDVLRKQTEIKNIIIVSVLFLCEQCPLGTFQCYLLCERLHFY